MVVLSHTLAKPTKVTGHVTQGPAGGIVPPGRLHEDDSTPLSMSCSKMMGSHFFHQRLPITGLQSLHHDFWHWERGRRIKKTMQESSTSSSPWRQTTGLDRKGLGALLSTNPDLLCTTKLHIMRTVLLPPFTGLGVQSQCKIVAVSTCVL